MPRVQKGAARTQKHKKIMKAARGHLGSTGSHYRMARQSTLRAGAFAYRDRRARKRDFRGLWITRISAACELRNTRYSKFIADLKAAGIELNRKMLSEIAVADPAMFDQLVETCAR